MVQVMVGRSPWTAADAPVGLFKLCKMLSPLCRQRDQGVPRGPGGPPHQGAANGAVRTDAKRGLPLSSGGAVANNLRCGHAVLPRARVYPVRPAAALRGGSHSTVSQPGRFTHREVLAPRRTRRALASACVYRVDGRGLL